MSLNEQIVGVQSCERLKLPLTNALRLQTYIGNALNNMAREVANDPLRRRLLLTDRTTATASITSSGQDYYASLTTLQTSRGVMLEYLQYGTIFYTYAPTFVAANVNTTTNAITLTAHSFFTGDPVRFT